MKKAKYKYYVVLKGRKVGIYTSWPECYKQVKKYSNAKFKGFKTMEEAENFYKRTYKTLPKDLTYKEEKKIVDNILYVDNCIICGKPFMQKMAKKGKRKNHPYCPLCQKDKNIKKAFFNKMQRTNQTAQGLLKNQRELYKRDKNIKGIPPYIYLYFKDDKEIISVKGDMKNPKITYRCKRCDKQFSVRWFDYRKDVGHDCDGLKSSGEAIVEDYLKNNDIPYKTQRETLRCVNPATNAVMPYDFELPTKKVIIEVQGEQHRKFIPVFHIDEEGFEYQKEKDRQKKAYAIEKGYTFIEIWYDEFDNKEYINKIDQAINK